MIYKNSKSSCLGQLSLCHRMTHDVISHYVINHYVINHYVIALRNADVSGACGGHLGAKGASETLNRHFPITCLNVRFYRYIYLSDLDLPSSV